MAKNNKPLLSKRTMRKFIREPTKEAVGKNMNHSIVGEFFDNKQYKKFINSAEAQKVIEKYVPGLKVNAHLEDRKYYLTHDAPASKDDGLIIAIARPSNTHFVPVIDMEKNQVFKF
ncbi:hypothetical protein ACQKII_23595 [Lysinibacillus sp. NPDC048646]|uniref:hypothetical protein n=1 Tax=Lysinibacillus sp. NPDC048646 TaxID=3390574 RepID=UPI003D01BBB0